MVAAYTELHDLGVAHSVESWQEGELVGGLYSLSIGRVFFGESMFSWRTDASKIALAALVAFCRVHGIELIDCQQHTRHLASFGAREVPRATFEKHLAKALAEPTPKRWTYDRAMWAQLGLAPRNTPEATLAP
jgi:leucyl/phenylalanyl-tRNA--protein transferase